VSIIIDKDKLARLLQLKPTVTVVTIPAKTVNGGAIETLYEDTGDLIFIYTSLGWEYRFLVEVISETASYSYGAPDIYYSIFSVVTSGYTVIRAHNRSTDPLTTKPIIVVKFNFGATLSQL
jgi:hypothetical protein